MEWEVGCAAIGNQTLHSARTHNTYFIFRSVYTELREGESDRQGGRGRGVCNSFCYTYKSKERGEAGAAFVHPRVRIIRGDS